MFFFFLGGVPERKQSTVVLGGSSVMVHLTIFEDCSGAFWGNILNHKGQ